MQDRRINLEQELARLNQTTSPFETRVGRARRVREAVERLANQMKRLTQKSSEEGARRLSAAAEKRERRLARNRQRGDALIESLTAISVAACAMILIYGFIFVVSSKTCDLRWNASGVQSQYGFLSGCRVQVDGKWIPENRYRTLNEE